jgi:hypothetical protein
MRDKVKCKLCSCQGVDNTMLCEKEPENGQNGTR